MASGGVRPYEMASTGLRAIAEIGQENVLTDTRLHLDLVQLWRCPIAWCTTWKGSPQDCLEHVRSGHDAPLVSKTASIEKFAPLWTVRRRVWTDSLRVDSSGISMDILLFSEVGMPLTQHYRVYKGGLPHAVFRTDYLSRIRSLLPSPEGDDTPLQTGSVSTPKSVRRQHRVTQPKRLFAEAVGEGPLLTEQNPTEMASCNSSFSIMWRFPLSYLGYTPNGHLF